ncbi:MAG: S41 family peptidase [Wenzhouxiangella sp.]
MTRTLCLSLLALLALSSHAQTSSERWLREPALSPDGAVLVFTHAGDIYRVDTAGGIAVPLTLTDAVESNPRWSPDGSHIAYSSDRNGTLDVYLLDLAGGPARRLTYHQADDVVTGFSADGSAVLFESVRYDPPDHAADPHQRRPELYEVPVTGGTPRQVTPIEARQAVWDFSGERLLYADYKGDDFYRKHDDSPFARDIWLLDEASGSHERLTTSRWNDHTPVWDASGEGFYFISERSGSLNVWHQTLAGGEASARQVTFHTRHPVRGLSVAANGMLSYGFDGEVYLLPADAERAGAAKGSVPVAINLLGADTGDGTIKTEVEGNISEFVVSPNDKEIAFVLRGDVFVTAMDFSTTRRITRTPGLERNLAFTPDGRGLLYAAEREAQWAIFESRLSDPDESYFFTATLVEEGRLIDGSEHAGGLTAAATHPNVAPDGRHVAYLDDWAEVRVFDRQTEKSISVVPGEVNFSIGNNDIHFDWSPDSRFLAVDIQPSGRLFFHNVALVPADGSAAPLDLTRSGYMDARPRWHDEGQLIAWTTARYGPRQHGGHGAQLDVHAQFLNQEAFDRFRRSKEQIALDEEAAPETDDEEPADEKPAPVEFDAAGASERQTRLTIHSSDLADFALNGDASKLYYISAFESGYDLWAHDFREEKTAKLVALGARRAALAITSDDKTAVVLADGGLSKISLEGDSAAAEPVKIDLSVTLDADAERRAMLHHVWLTTRDRIYDPAVLAEADWDGMYEHYQGKLAGIHNNVDFVELLNEFIGELNVSHAYARYRRTPKEPTGALGAILDHRTGDEGIRIATVLVPGPLAQASDRVRDGHRIVAVDGQAVGSQSNLYAHLRNGVGQRLRLTLRDDAGRYDVVLKPVSMGQETEWRHEHWVESRHQLVETLSDGRLGYVYISQMSDTAYRRVYSDLFGRHFTKEGVVIDVRDNGGGDLVDWLVQLFTGRQYMWNVPDGRIAQGEPLTEWVKPSVALTNQGAYSDGHCFVAAWQNLGISTLVGTPVGGTCTYAGWETLASGDIRAGTPRLGIKDAEGDWLERKTTYPDITVYPDPNRIAAGEDGMLARAVEVLLSEIDGEE